MPTSKTSQLMPTVRILHILQAINTTKMTEASFRDVLHLGPMGHQHMNKYILLVLATKDSMKVKDIMITLGIKGLISMDQSSIIQE